MTMAMRDRRVGDLLRDWRRQRRRSQLDLALDAEISTRHLSFIETGRAKPSRDMVLRIAEHLEIPPREQNALLNAAGFAAVHPERRLDDPALSAARAAVELVLKGHEPCPALAIDRHWTLISANAAVFPLLAGVSPGLLEPPVNVLRLSLHPDGLAPRIANLGQWRAHLLHRLRQQIAISNDADLAALLGELEAYPAPDCAVPPPAIADLAGVAVPLHLVTTEGALLSFLSTTTVFGTPIDITLSELALESFFPADRATAELLRERFQTGASDLEE